MESGGEALEPRGAVGHFRWQRAVPWLLVAAALAHPIARGLARWDWRIDLLTHFQGVALVVTLGSVVGLARRHRRLAAALLVLALVQVEPLVRYQGGNPVSPDPKSTDRLRILLANVLVDNPDHERLIQLVHQERPDVLALVEVSKDWLAGLTVLRRDYPYRISAPDGARGLALWSRHPLTSSEGPTQPTDNGWPFLHATLRFAGQDLDLWLVHPASPLRRRHYERRGYLELRAIAERVGREAGPRLVVGDLNTTAGSPYFAEFLRVSGLRDSRLGFGPQPSWPTWSPYRIAIDHALPSRELAVVERRLGPMIGSDHRPLILVLAPAAGVRYSEVQSSQSSP
ncbi:MAG: endonuclease/exonuclease/phosphatase family protein [Isosphaeraceae bacterium]